jgi:hypothetical protein
MKASELTVELVRNAILPANMMKDQEATIKWLVLPEALRPNRSRAAERIAPYINPNGTPKRAEPLPIPPPSNPPPAPEASVVKEDRPGGPAPEPVEEKAPESSPVVASVDIKQDGSVTVHPPKRPSSFPPAPAIGSPLAVSLTTQDPAPEAAPVEQDLSPEAALRAIRALYKSWKGGQYVCGNAFKTMNKVEELIKRAGF